MTGRIDLNSIRMVAGGKKAEILIYDVIGESFFFEGVTAKNVAESMAAIGSAEEIDVRINSPGGSVFQGMAIYNGLKNHPAKINVHIDGLAASMATVVAMAGDTINMAKNAMFMIHEPRASVYGTAEDMLSQASMLEKLTSQVVDVYTSRTQMSESDVRAAMSAETWYAADEAKAAGLVTNITANKQITAHFDVTTFDKAPQWAQTKMKALVAVPEQKVEPMTKETPETPKAEAVDVEAIKAQAIKEERERITEIHALCNQAQKPEMAAKFCESPTMSAADVRVSLFDVLCKSNVPVGDGGGSGVDQTPDENAKYKAEFKAGSYKMTEEQFVSLRRAEDGLESFVK